MVRSWATRPLRRRAVRGEARGEDRGPRCVVLTPCRGCGAEVSRCREVLPACRKIAADRRRRRLNASANGFASVADEAANDQRRAIEDAVLRATRPLRTENARLRAEIRRLQAEATVPGRRA